MRASLFTVLLVAVGTESADLATIVARVSGDDRATRTLGAIGAQHFARAHWGFSLLGRPGLRPWQRSLAPVVPPLVDMLEDDRGLEWVDEDGNGGNATTPRREATLALLAFERASVEPLISALDRRPLAQKIDGVLRRLTRSGPPEHDRAAWQRWWEAHRDEALPNERGQLGPVVLALLALVVVGALVFRRQRREKRRLGVGR